MKVVANVSDIVQRYRNIKTHYVLIVEDEKTNRKCYGLFTPLGNTNVDRDIVHSLFERSINILYDSTDIFMATHSFPILYAIGPAAITLIKRNLNGHVAVSDMTGSSVDSHIGLE